MDPSSGREVPVADHEGRSPIATFGVRIGRGDPTAWLMIAGYDRLIAGRA